ncbi:MAG: hypothetical protein ABI765_17870 [Gemmatimonadota bacterium]
MALRPSFLLAFAALLSACGAKSIYVHDELMSQSDPEKILACTKAQFDSMKYKVSRYDVDDHRLEGKKLRPDIQRSDPSFYRAFDEIEALITPDATGHTKVALQGHSYFDSRTYQGPKDLEQPASDTVKADMARVADRCGKAAVY